MSNYYDETTRNKYNDLGYDKALQFSTGDLCLFEQVYPDDDIKLGEVYGYQYKNIIITHRLVGTYINDTGKIFYIFRGDNNPGTDPVLVSANNILYHYTGTSLKAIGSFILYAQSYFGI